MKKYLIALVVLLSAASLFAGGSKESTAPATQNTQQAQSQAVPLKNPDTVVFATYGDVATLDPATEYDSQSQTAIKLLYEPLITYDGSSTEKFVPVLATEVPTVENGGIKDGGKTYVFHIRQGVKFHNGDPMTAEDVAYSVKRVLVLDQDGQYAWMVWTAFFGGDISGSRDGKGNIVVSWNDINGIAEAKGNDVIFHLKKPWAPFLSMLATPYGDAVVDKKFVTANGGWDGTEATWKQHNNPAMYKETLASIANGTGPYKLTRWDKGNELVVDRFDGYWGPKPTIREGILKVVKEWSTRKLMLLQGDADIVDVDPQYYPEMDKEAGLTVQRAQPTLDITAMFFNFKVATKDNPYVGSGKLDGEGIPPDFFSDPNVRKGFLSAWDEQTYIKQGINGNGIDPVTPFPKGLPYKDESLKRMPFDMKAAADYLKKAYNGQLWEKGFKFQIFYNTGNNAREVAAKMLAENIAQVNPKFQIQVSAIEWPQYLQAYRQKTLPIFIIGWGPDYPDPDDYADPFMSSTGAYAGKQSYNNPEVDKLVLDARFSTDPSARKADYYRLQQIYLQDNPGTPVYQNVRNIYWTNHVSGMNFNPMYSQSYLVWLPYMTKK
ncbi:MAG TPA: ABC transporter substrate-binding protein [Spirochaetia bacterium]|nr:ABC transporter substrate-binding protein [Spirochaetia bacterium]